MKKGFIALFALFALSAVASSEPPRIAALSPHSVEMLYAIGAGGQIIATVEYADFPEAANQHPRIGRYDRIDLEQLLLLQPDLVIISESDTAEQLLVQIKQLGFKVINTSVTHIDQVAERLEQLGELTGHVDQANQVATEFRRELAEIRQQYRDKTPVKLFYQVWPEPLTTVSGGWTEQIFDDCGAKNIFTGQAAAYPQVSVEQVLLRAPDVIIQPVDHGNEGMADQDWSKWQEIPAIANDLIIRIDADLVHRVGPRILTGMRHICEAVDQARMLP